MSLIMPMFPLNTVTFPGMSMPLRVFEERYVDLVEYLLTIEDRAERLFGTVAIREGFEVGDHGKQSLYRVGVRMQATEVTAHDDGTFTLEATARDRIVLDALDASGNYPVGEVSLSPDGQDDGPLDLHDRARAAFTAYRAAISDIQGTTFSGHLPQDPGYLSWTLAALSPLPMAERQQLLEADNPSERLVLVTEFLRAELRAMNVIPSLPATEVARTAWSPN